MLDQVFFLISRLNACYSLDINYLIGIKDDPILKFSARSSELYIFFSKNCTEILSSGYFLNKNVQNEFR